MSLVVGEAVLCFVISSRRGYGYVMSLIVVEAVVRRLGYAIIYFVLSSYVIIMLIEFIYVASAVVVVVRLDHNRCCTACRTPLCDRLPPFM